MLAASDGAPPRHLLPVITVAQLLCASLWFAVNGVLGALQRDFGLGEAALGWLTSSVMFGFIVGTLCFAVLMIADRFSMRRVFLFCAIVGAAVNAAAVPLASDADVLSAPLRIAGLAGLRFATGFCLAGIYPVGMKLAASWYRGGLGAALGYLVGALVIGTALPHLLRALGANWPWQQVMLTTSLLALVGGVLVAALAPDGPFAPRGTPITPKALVVIVRDPKVRASAFGYFGHMWELYAMLALVPTIIAAWLHSTVSPAVSLLSFVVIAAGGLGCIAGGILARRCGSAWVAATFLAVSGLCALAAPLMAGAPWWLFAVWLLVWGTSVSADSPQFSTLTARNSPPEIVGSVLTLVNCIGFSITIAGIQLLSGLALSHGPWQVLPLLAIGPALGLLAMRPLLRRQAG